MAVEKNDSITKELEELTKNTKGIQRISFFISKELLKDITMFQLDYGINRSQALNLLLKLGYNRLKELYKK